MAGSLGCWAPWVAGALAHQTPGTPDARAHRIFRSADSLTAGALVSCTARSPGFGGKRGSSVQRMAGPQDELGQGTWVRLVARGR